LGMGDRPDILERQVARTQFDQCRISSMCRR
jgi:hypothetical protein